MEALRLFSNGYGRTGWQSALWRPVILLALTLAYKNESAQSTTSLSLFAQSAQAVLSCSTTSTHACTYDAKSPRISWLLLDAQSGELLASNWPHTDQPIPMGSLMKPFIALAYPYYSVACPFCLHHPENWKRRLDAVIRPNDERGRLDYNQVHGWSAIPSSTFTQTRTQVDGRGIGHGLGLCQRGATAMAKNGATFDDILGHYYPNTIVDT